MEKEVIYILTQTFVKGGKNRFVILGVYRNIESAIQIMNENIVDDIEFNDMKLICKSNFLAELMGDLFDISYNIEVNFLKENMKEV